MSEVNNHENDLKRSIVTCLDLLSTGYKVKYVECYPSYDDRIIDVIKALNKAEHNDVDYLSKIKDIRDNPINTMDLEDIYTYLTFIFRQERFCDGLIAKFIANGMLKKLLERYIELVSH